MRSKFGNVRTNGFASKKEAKRYQELKLLEDAGEVRDIKCQVRYPLKIHDQLICTYVSDFDYEERFWHKDWLEYSWRPRVNDAKGFRTPIYKLKAKLMKAIHGIEILET